MYIWYFNSLIQKVYTTEYTKTNKQNIPETLKLRHYIHLPVCDAYYVTYVPYTKELYTFTIPPYMYVHVTDALRVVDVNGQKEIANVRDLQAHIADRLSNYIFDSDMIENIYLRRLWTHVPYKV